MPNPHGLVVGHLFWRPRLKVFSDLSGKLTYNHETGIAKSYGHWWLSRRMSNGDVVMNDYRYSQTTWKHRSKLLKFFQSNNITVHHRIASPKGLASLKSAEIYYTNKKEMAWIKLEKPRIQAYTRENIIQQIADLNLGLVKVQYLRELEDQSLRQALDGSTKGVVNL